MGFWASLRDAGGFVVAFVLGIVGLALIFEMLMAIGWLTPVAVAAA